MKPLLIAAALLLAPAAASAQVAAGSVPNTFDDPAARARAASAQAAARTAPAPQTAPTAPTPPPLSPEPANEASEETLRTLIAQLQAGEPDYSRMTETIATAVRDQAAATQPVIDSLGPLVTLDFMGSRGNIDFFNVTFANAATEWRLGLNPEGKISALLFRPAE